MTTDKRAEFYNMLADISPALITLMIFMGVIAVKGIFPFGSNRIDYYDMGQTNAPLYYHIWDFLHGRSALMFDWYINEGQNLSMGSAVQWNISPFNLFWLFVPRRMVFQILSIYTGLHLMAMSFNMGIFLKKVIKPNTLYRVAFSTAYGLCGYTLTHYTIPTYLDTAVFIPLLLLMLYRLLHDGKYMGYMLMLGFMTAMSYYLGFMDMIFILLISGAYIILISAPEKKGETAARLVTSTVCGTALSAFMLLPAAMQMRQSSRFNSNLSGGFFDTVKSILSSIGADMYYIKWWQLSGSICALAVIAAGVIVCRKEMRTNIFLLLFIFFPCSLIPFESINLLWHFGTYYHYPIRCGYLIPFALLTAAAYYAERLFPNPASLKKWQLLFCTAVSAGMLILFGRYYSGHSVWEIHGLFRAWIIMAAVLFILYSLIIFLKKPAMLIFPMAFELILCAYVGYGCPHFQDKFSSDPEQSGDYVITSQKLMDDLKPGESRLERIKDPDTELNANYGMVMRTATIGGWANTATRRQIDGAVGLGYTAHFMRILDSGGTAFTDAVLGVRKLVTDVPYEASAVYKKTGSADGYYLYDSKAVLPFGIAVSEDAVSTDISSMSITEIQNMLYTSMGGKGDIAETISANSFRVSGNTAVYMQGGNSDRIQVNGRNVAVPTIGDAENTEFPAWFNSNVLYLGSFRNENVSINGISGGKIMLLDLDRLEELSRELSGCDTEAAAGKSTLSLYVKGTDERRYALLPMNFDPGWHVSVNGKRVRAAEACGLFMAVPVDKGMNSIKMYFMPQGLIPGIIISLAAGMAAAFMYCRKMRFRERDEAVCKKTLYAVWWLAVLLLYIIPIACFMVHEVAKRI